jgi:predicted HicB family RNase H-like nuclease
MVLLIKIRDMKMLEYKGYAGSIEYSKDDNCLYGEVLGLNKEICITYEGSTAEELYNDFKNGIDHYLEDCKEEGIQPGKPHNGVFYIHVPSEIQVRMAMYVENHGTSINSFIRDSIEKQLETVV